MWTITFLAMLHHLAATIHRDGPVIPNAHLVVKRVLAVSHRKAIAATSITATATIGHNTPAMRDIAAATLGLGNQTRRTTRQG